MTCRRASQIDVSAFLLDDGGDAFSDFREHFVECDACADVVSRWMAFDHALATSVESAGAALHPEPAALADYARSRAAAAESTGTGGSASIRSIAAHLERCAACATELALLERFDSSAMQGALASLRAELAEAEDEASAFASWPARVLAWVGDALRTPLGVGGLAAAAALLLFFAAGSPIVGPDPGTDGSDAGPLAGRTSSDAQSPRLADVVQHAALAESPEPAASPIAAAAEPPPPVAPPPSPASPPLPLAQASPPARPSVPLAQASPPARPSVPLAQASPPLPPANPPRTSIETPAPSPPAPSPAASDDPPREILLAALTDLPGVDYGRPSNGAGEDWRRPDVALRSGTAGPDVKALAPSDHVGLTLHRKPRLWWFLPEATDHAIELTIVDDDAIDPVLGVERPGPHAAGPHPFDLSTADVELRPGTRYRWFVTLVVDPDRPSRNPISFGAFEVVGETDPRRAEIAGAPPAERGHALARAGLWYDAYDFFATLALEHPDVPVLARHRERLVELVHALE